MWKIPNSGFCPIDDNIVIFGDLQSFVHTKFCTLPHLTIKRSKDSCSLTPVTLSKSIIHSYLMVKRCSAYLISNSIWYLSKIVILWICSNKFIILMSTWWILVHFWKITPPPQYLLHIYYNVQKCTYKKLEDESGSISSTWVAVWQPIKYASYC